jgi:hypothetical protein
MSASGVNRPTKRRPHELEQHPPYATVDDGVLFPHCADTTSLAQQGRAWPGAETAWLRRPLDAFRSEVVTGEAPHVLVG